MKRAIVCLVLMFFSFSVISFAASPFEKSPKEKALLHEKFLQMQREGSSFINKTIRSLKQDFTFLRYMLLFFFSIIYGFLHSAGPGHGKALIAAYVMKNKSNDITVSNLAFMVSFVHTSSAIIMAVLLSTLLSSFKGIARIKMQTYFSFFSGLLICAVGLWFLISKLRGHEIGKVREGVQAKGSVWVIGLSAGIVPCPIALLIMLLTIPAGVVWIGITAVLGMSLGMYLLLFIVGELTLKSRSRIVKRFEKDLNISSSIDNILSFVSVAAIIVVGLGMTFFFYPF